MTSHTPTARPMPTSTPVLKRILLWGAAAALGIAVTGAVIGGLIVGMPGVMGAVLGTVLALVFLAVTAASILFSNRFIGSEMFVAIFFSVVLGSWLLKFAAVIVVEIILIDQAWLNPLVFFLSIIAQIVASLIIDVIVVVRSRMPHVSDLMPRPEIPQSSSESTNENDQNL